MRNKLILIMFCMLLLVGTVSAWDFDNVEEYDKETKTAKIKDCNLWIGFCLIEGDNIAEITLDTPHENVVKMGVNITFAEITLNQIRNEDYEDVLSKMELFDLTRDGEKIERQIDYKYLTTRKVEIITEERIYNKDNSSFKIKEHKEIIEEEYWEEFNFKRVEKGIYNIRLIMQINFGDKIEWIPTLYGVKIPEWAIVVQSSGSETIDGDFTVHTFTSNGYFNVSGDTLNVSVLVVAGGGGGGPNAGPTGGGGAGGLIYDYAHDVTAGGYEVFVGAGGFNTNGVNSSVFGKNAMGGGEGGTYNTDGIKGGSGGGGGANGAHVGGLGETDQGFAGGDGYPTDSWGGGGGGGASEVGANGGGSAEGVGGDGLGYTIFNGTELFYAGGGGGGGDASHEGSIGGVGGGGEGGKESDHVGTSAINGTGGGAGGGGGTGGDGIIIIRYLTADTELVPTVTLLTPINNTNSTSATIPFNCTASDDTNLVNVSFILDGVVNETNSTPINSSVHTFTKTLAEGNHFWTCRGANNASKVTTAGEFLISIHITPAILEIFDPTGNLGLVTIGDNLTLNWSITEVGQNLSAHIDNCSYIYNSVETFLNITTCVETNTTQFLYVKNVNNLSFKVVEEFNLTTENLTSWTVPLVEINQSFTSSVTEGSSSTFTANFFTNGSGITIANLSYNGTQNIGTITNTAGNNFTVTRIIVAPVITSDSNLSFFWNITQRDFSLNLTAQNQTVNNIALDNCTDNTIILYNFTIVDEVSQIVLLLGNPNTTVNTTGRIDLQLMSIDREDILVDFSTFFNKTNPFYVCINDIFGSAENYVIDVQVEYDADNYEVEFYNIQNDTITSTDIDMNITLYDLLTASSQVFRIVVKDSSFLALQDALVEVQRKYVDEGVFKNVEIPKTDDKGETVAKLVLNDVIYNLIVKRFGETLISINNVRAECQNPLVVACEIEINDFVSGLDVPDYEVGADFNYTLDYNSTSRVVRSVFDIPSGEPATIVLTVTREDALGTAVCTDTLTSTAGTLSCVVPSNFGNATVLAKLTKDGTEQAKGNIKIDQNPADIFGTALLFLSLFSLLTLIGAAVSDNPVFTIIFLMVGVIFIFGINLVANFGFIGGSATILWLFVAMIIVIIKIGRRN